MILNQQTFLPEGYLYNFTEQQKNFKNITLIQEHINSQKILESRAILCDANHNLIVDLGCMKGIIPKDECAIGITEGFTKDIAIISKVNKPVCFIIKEIKYNNSEKPIAILSRKAVQEKCQKEYVEKLIPGDVIKGKITHLESFGCFVDIGCGIISLIPIDSISVSRISHPKDRFKVGQNIMCVVKSIDNNGKVLLSHKELLGTWEENIKNFTAGETVAGVIRSIENYGVFVELAPNLAGLAELKDDVKIGQQASIYIKSIIPEKMKIKLIIVDNFDCDYINLDFDYYINSSHIDFWKYSPDNTSKIIESSFT